MKNPMMPKGVEHQGIAATVQVRMAVKNPMMPKGVEHSASQSQLSVVPREESYDAERR